MSKGNKGLWNSPRKLLQLAAVAVATAMPLQAQVINDESSSTDNLSSGAQYTDRLTVPLNGDGQFFSGGNRGSGTLTLSYFNLYTGFATTYGSIYFGSSAPGYVTPVPATNAGTLTLTGNTTLSPDSPLLLAHEGADTLTLSGSNTYSGATTVSGGILQINPPPPLNSGGTIQLTASTLTYSGYVPYSGTIVNGGTLLLSSAAPIEPAPSVEEETTAPTAPTAITLSVIPEPSTLGLLIGTALSAGLIRSRRKLK